MSDSGPKQIGFTLDVKPHAYDPVVNPELFAGVLPRRVVAFLIDVLMVTMPIALMAIFIVAFGIVTFGLGWLLFGLMPAAITIWAVVYYGWTLGGPASATLGMRAVDLEMRTWYGAPCYFLLGAVHAVVFWITISILSPLILVVAMFNSRQRLLHDMLLGTIVINNEARARALRQAAGVQGP
jgi:uncharacterized RDD family membrane protein YckC